MIILIACMSQNRVIGKDGKMPWHNQEELNYFKEVTMGHHVLMGATTYIHLPKALEGRIMHILTSKQTIPHQEKITLWHDLDAIIKQFQASDEILYVCGGASVYEQCLPYADYLYISILPETYEGDRYFPAWKKEDFECVKQMQFHTFKAYQYKRK